VNVFFNINNERMQLRKNNQRCALDMGMDVNFLLGNKGVYCLKIEELKGSAELQWQAQKTALRISPSSNFCHCALAQNYIDADFFTHGTTHCRLAQSLQMKKSISINYGVLHDHLSLALLAYEGYRTQFKEHKKWSYTVTF